MLKLIELAKIRNQYNQVIHLTKDTTWASDKNTIKHHKTRAKRLALSQKVTTGQQWTDAKAWQTQDTNNTNDAQKKSTQVSMKFQLLVKTKMLKKWRILFLSNSNVGFIMLINVKMPTVVGILTFMSRINFMLSWQDFLPVQKIRS